jgi:serine/threonine protein kinase
MQRGERVAGRFEILAEAGRGGMGTVFRALDRRDRREVALKVIASRGTPRFEREAAILAAIDHPNVVTYVAHGATPDGLCYLVMEWVDGENLAQRLDRDGIDPRETVALGVQLARALRALHARGIVHRDLKPSNVMLLGGDVARVKLVDFGVARRAAEVSSLTRTGAMIGTAGYMSPEQARGVRGEVDGRADLFALGCVLHECLTGLQAFAGETTLATRAKVLLHDPPPLRLVQPALPAALDDLVGRLLAKRPADRPDASETETALAAVADLPAGRTVRAPQPIAYTTVTPASEDLHLCALLVAWPGDDDRSDAVDDLVADVRGAVEPLDGGLVVTVAGEPVTVARLALAILARVPTAAIAVIAGDTPQDLIDRGAHLLAEIDIVGDSAAGIWVDPAIARRLGDGFLVESAGARVRLRGVAA